LNAEIRKHKQDKPDSSSSLQWAKIKSVYGALIPYIQEKSNVPAPVMSAMHDYLGLLHRTCGTLAGANEQKRLLFIAPILVHVCGVLNDIEILCEEVIEGRHIEVNGRFEFVLKRGGKRVCILEAKKDDMDQGLVQNLLGMEALADIENAHTVYGIVSNYLEWMFITSLDSEIKMELTTLAFANGIPAEASLADIAGKILSMLS
jgi:hypothetical protein